MDRAISKKILKKHIAIIHCINQLSALERKISNALLAYAYDELLMEDTHCIAIKDVCRLINYKGNNHSVIKQAIRTLMTSVMEWNITNERTGDEDWAASTYLASVAIRSGKLKYSYSPLMRTLLSHPSMYAKINLTVQARFKSSYGLALYENCMRYKNVGRTKWFSITLFRKLMGVPENKYKVFRDFKKRVIEKAVEEVNRYSDIIVHPEFKKVARKVTEIQLLVRDNGLSCEEDEADDIHDTDVDIIMLLAKGYGFAPPAIRKFLQAHSTVDLEGADQYIKNLSSYKAGQIQNLQAYFIKVLKEKYSVDKSSRDLINYEFKRKKIEKKIKREEDLRAKEEEADLLKRSYEIIYDAYTKLPKKAQSSILLWFKKTLARTRDYCTEHALEKYGLKNELTKKEFARFLIKARLVLIDEGANIKFSIPEGEYND